MHRKESRHTVVLTLVCSGIFMLLLDMTIVSAALAEIQRDFQSSLGALTWLIDAYALPMAAGLMLFATAGDRLGRKRVFLVGIALFTLASLACALSTSALMLNLCRGVQGVGGAMVLAVSLPMISRAFEGTGLSSFAMATYGGVMGAAAAAGPLVGGLLVDTWSWEAIFLVNVPIGIILIVAASVAIPSSAVDGSSETRPIDYLGSALSTVTLVALTVALIEGKMWGWWTSGRFLGLLVLAAIFAALFAQHLLRSNDPMIDPALLRNRAFLGTCVAGAAASATLVAGANFLALHYMNILGFSPLEAGIRALPLTIAATLGAPLGMLLMKFLGSRPTIPLVLFVIAGGLALLAGISDDATWAHFIPGSIVAGVGIGAMQATISAASVSFAPSDRTGMATGTIATARQVGIILGTAGLGALYATVGSNSARSRLDDALPAATPQERVDELADSIGTAAGLPLLDHLPAQFESARDLLADVIVGSSTTAMNALLFTAAAVSAVLAVVCALLLRRGSRAKAQPATR